MNSKSTKTIISYTVSILLVIVACFSAIYFLTSKDSYSKNPIDIWDGTTVATAFYGGNGSEENPYLISNGEELLYFKSLIEGDDSSNYLNKYYVLNNDIDLGNHEIIPFGTLDKIFSGNFDGCGHTIQNFKIKNGVVINNINYYGFFTSLNNATVKNINFNTVTINPTDSSNNPYIVGSFAGKINGGVINNISITNTFLIFDNISNNYANHLGGVVGDISSDTSFSNIYINAEISSLDNISMGRVSYVNNSDTSYIITNYDTSLNISNFVETTTSNTYQYNYLNGEYINENGEVVNNTNIIIGLNTNLDTKYYWEDQNGIFVIKILEQEEVLKIKSSTPTRYFAFSVNEISLHDSGVSGDTLYINDLTSDYNNYMGLNYTDYSNTGTLPTGASRNLYSDSNLAKIYISYDGTSVSDASVVGFIGPSEQVSELVYYKYYPVVNGYVTIELIDNPFGDRPNDKAFNGWVTDYPGAEVYLDSDTYTRYCKIPVNNTTNPISIYFMSSWITAEVGYVTANSSNAWTNALNAINNRGMIAVEEQIVIYEYNEDMRQYYFQGNINNREYYPNGAYNKRGQNIAGNRCNSWGGCTYYYHPTDSEYDSNLTYYRLRNNNMQVYTPTPSNIRYENNPDFSVGESSAGFFRQVSISRGNSIEGYYDSDGNILSGNCNSNTCNYYELIQYYTNGVENEFTQNNDYYYLVTRDTNIVVLRHNNDYTFSTTKPLTLTSYYNDTSYINSAMYSLYSARISAGEDLCIEYIRLSSERNYANTDPTSSSTANGYIYGNWYNLKIGRGIAQYNNYKTAYGVIGGDNDSTGSTNDITKYKTIVESGFYDVLILTNGSVDEYSESGWWGSSGARIYVEAKAIYGNDYDRIGTNNNNLIVYYCASGSWGGTVYDTNTQTGIALHTNVKSGSFGTGKHDYSTGIYIGGRGGGTHYAAREATIEGGYIYNLIGGPLTADNRSNINDSYINIKGGSIDVVIGGAGASTTYGNRIINLTGGTVNYALFGGSNGITGGDTGNYQGVLTGSTFVHVGGNAHVGGGVGTLTDVYEGTPGSVFGAGNGNADSTKVGTVSNSNILITGGTIDNNVYGGGNYGATGTDLTNGTTTTNIKVKGGTVSGNIYGGGNNNGAGKANVISTINIDVDGGTISNVYGGSCAKGTVYGSTDVSITDGTITGDVYGGGEGGWTDSNHPGTFVTQDVNVVIGTSGVTGKPTINGSVYGGSAFGTVNGATNTTNISNYDTTVTVNNGIITTAVFGGGKGSSTFTPYVEGDVTVNINGGNIGEVYGGNNASGQPNGDDTVYLSGGTIGNVYGGGNATGQSSTNVYLQGSTVNNLFGGSNSAGTVPVSHVTVTSGVVSNVYGGNNLAGTTQTTNVSVTGGSVTGDIYGGGKQADSTTTNVTISGATVNNVYGGGERASATTTNVTTTNSTLSNLFGGSNVLGTVNQSYVTTTTTTATNVYGGNNAGGTTNTSAVRINSGTIGTVYGGGDHAITGNTNVIISGGNITSAYGGGNEASATSTNVDITGGTIGVAFGGGNAAGVTGNTSLDIDNATITGNVYGGGNEGTVGGNTEVFITSATIGGSAYAGGNGSTAIVTGNTSITVDGNTIVGTSGCIPPAYGSVFGGGNAAATGYLTSPTDTGSSIATVNIVGGTIYGNVYGGANTSVVNGRTIVNIGSSAVNNNSLTENNLSIGGTVFGGGEANASGSDTYDWNFISVTSAIDITIDGTGYTTNNHTFSLGGSIFGSGNASTSTGTSTINIKKLGTASEPSRNISIQRTDNLIIDNSCIELAGIRDSTNDYASIAYSFNRIGSLVIKNNTTLLLKRNANMLESFYSGVDVNGTLVPAAVTIDEDGNITSRNVDNRLYMIPDNNLNVAHDPDATSYGRVTGMTFFGMYQNTDSSDYFGVYDPDVENGDSADAGDIIFGGSYVLGLHSVNHDITVDGFYSNFLDDEYTEVQTKYIDPTEVGETGYRWVIGIDAINYEVNLNASKYSSLGTSPVQLLDFGNGDTIINVVGFNSANLTTGVQLIDPSNVMKVANTAEQANHQLGLAMKAETSGWTGYGTTKLLSANGGSFDGDRTYQTDSQALVPTFMFYLYHAKNITTNEDLGSAIVTLQVLTPINPIEYRVQLVTITVNITASNFQDEDAYDASITYDKRYDMPSATSVKITNQSQFTTYYSLFAYGDSFQDFYGLNNSYYHALVTNYPLAVGTQITMLDYGVDQDNPEYYYFTVDQADYNRAVAQLATDNEITYRLSNFIKMDSTSSANKYSDPVNNDKYYTDEYDRVVEEFIFIFDFKETTLSGTHTNIPILFELRNAEDRTLISVLGIRQTLMRYNLYDSGTAVLSQTVTPPGDYMYYDVPYDVSYSTTVGYDQTEGREAIINTNYESSSMGLNVTLLDSSNTQVTSSLLTGTKITINNIDYFADSDGIFRIKLANKVANLNRTVSITTDNILPSGNYTLVFDLFASPDGRHNSHTLEAASYTKAITVVGSDNSIVVDTTDKTKVVFADTGLNANGDNYNTYIVTYNSVLTNPNVRVSVYKRDITSATDTTYTPVDFNDLFNNNLATPSGNYVGRDFERMLTLNASSANTLYFYLADDLVSGTYRVDFKLYDNNQLIQDEYKYVIVKRNVE